MAEDANPLPQPQAFEDRPHQPPPVDTEVKDPAPRDADQLPPPPPPQETMEEEEEEEEQEEKTRLQEAGGNNHLDEDRQPPHPTDERDPLAIPSESPAATADPPAGDQKAAAFTAAQLQELEQQTVIYRYMAARVPVPTHLVFPIWKTVTAASPAGAHQYPTLMGLATLCLDFLKEPEPEPGRCRRTDGKKWRCWRNVIPDQKYCERHMHRGRKRPFKPVELDDDADLPPVPIAALPAPEPVSVEDDSDQPATGAGPSMAQPEDNSAGNDAKLSISVSTAVGSG